MSTKNRIFLSLKNMNSGDDFSLKTSFNSNFQTLGAMESLEPLGVPLPVNICEFSKIIAQKGQYFIFLSFKPIKAASLF